MKRFLASLLLCAILFALVPFALANGAEKETAEKAQTVSVSSVQSASASAENTARTIAFDDIRRTLKQYNYSYRALRAAEKSLGDSEDELLAGIAQLKGTAAVYDGIIDGLETLESTAANMGDADMAAVYHHLVSLWNVNLLSLNSQIGSLEKQKLTFETTANTLTSSENQIVKGVESLYIAILTMENAVGDVQRIVDSLERAVRLTEKQRELGMASDYDVEGMKYNYESAESQLDGLRYQIRTSRLTLEGMLGMELNGTVTLGALTMPTEEELSGVNYEKTLSSALWQNAEYQNAEAEDADGTGSYEAAAAARDTFKYKFKIICMDVSEKQRLKKVAEDAVTYQERTFEIASKKYEMGMLSHEEYLSAEGALESAKSSLRGAELELFTAYRAYIWVSQYGIV